MGQKTKIKRKKESTREDNKAEVNRISTQGKKKREKQENLRN